MAAVATSSASDPLAQSTTGMSSPKLADSSTLKPEKEISTSSDTKSQNNNTTEGSNTAKSEVTEEKKATTNAPLAPPPKPSQSGAQNSSDYFGAPHNSAHFSLEPNPFEQSFGQPSSETPNRFTGVLPSVQSLTSPAPLGGPAATPDWQNSLRSGPLSPAMLTGPTGSTGDYFDSTFRQSFPTPNESSMRSTGLTPGGPSMFPAPSPNSQAIFNSMQSGGATPGTLDFHRSAMSAAARSKTEQPNQPQNSVQGINKSDYQPAQQSISQNPFNNNSESDAVNSLYMLANNGQRNPNQFMSHQSQGGNNVAQMRGNMKQENTPTNQRSQHHSVGGMSGSPGMSENGEFGYGSDGSANPKSSSKKSSKKGGKAASNNRRKQDDTPAKGPANKKSKANNGMPMEMDDDDDDDDEGSMKGEETGPGGKKLTDEEKRKNFLERNRVAALKCRQRKKQWLANLQAKVEIFTTENDALTNQCAQLREENQNLKALLIQHKDCAVSHSQGLGGARMAQVLGAEFDNPNNYGMGMGQQGLMMGQQHGGR